MPAGQNNYIILLSSIKKIIISLLLISTHFIVFSQEKKRVEILEAEILEAVKENPNALRLVGNQVKLKHDDILIWCDTAYTYTGSNKVDALGNVHINKGDTVNLYANKIYYNGDISFAQAMGNVKLENKTTNLFTDTLDYDLAANISYYNHFGKIIDSTNVLTSTIGKYFIDEDMIHFYKDVEGYSDDYILSCDTMIYNTKTSRISIVGPTNIRDSANTIYAEEGWYDTKTGEAELQKNPSITNDKQQLRASFIKYNDENGDGSATGRVELEDFESKVIVTGRDAIYNETLEIATITDSAVFMLYSNKDTLFLHADTLQTFPDTIKEERIIKAFFGVRFYRTDLQGVCDSLVYFSKDSLVQLYYNPIVWSDIHQLSADFIEMQQFYDSPNELHLTNNSFIISKQDSDRYDQIKGKNMIGYIVENKINKIDVDGNGQTLYYAREKDNQVIGLNRAESSNISIRFKDGEVFKIAFLKQPTGELKPLDQLNEEEKKLNGFDWKIKLRPLSKYDIFKSEETQTNENIPEVLELEN